MKKSLKIGMLLIAVVVMILSFAACNPPVEYLGKYYYVNNSSSWIQVKNNTCDYKDVYLGNAYFEDGTYAGIVTITGNGISYNAKASGKNYLITAEAPYDGGTLVISATFRKSTKDIILAGREYDK